MSSALINSFMTEVIKVQRFGVGEYVKGVYQPGDTTELEIPASVQPMKPNERLLLPEGQRTKEVVKIFTVERLCTTDERGGTKADIITSKGRLFEIAGVDDWTKTDLPHFMSIGVKVDGEGKGSVGED